MQSDQGLHCLPVLLNVNNTLTKKRKVNVQVFPSKGKPKNNTVQVSFVGEKCMLFSSPKPKAPGELIV